MSATVTQLRSGKPAPLRRGQYYWIKDPDGEVTPRVSVTNVLSEIAKQDVLIPWAAGQAFLAWTENPGIDMSQARAAPTKRRDKAADKGSLLHSFYEAWMRGGKLETAQLPTDHQGHAEGFLKWALTMRPELLLAESTVVNERYGYAGTGDLWANIGGLTYIVDYKTGFVDEFSCAMQEEAYARGDYGIDPVTRERIELPEVDAIAVLQTKGDGSYRWYELSGQRKAAWPTFRAYLHVWHARHDKPCPAGCFCNEVTP